MKQGIKKAMSLLLAMAFVLQTASVISLFQEDGRAFAAEMGGTSADVLDSLRIESNAVDIGADGDNPYSENKNKVINMFPRMELMMYNNVAGELKIYDYDQPVKGIAIVSESRKRLIWTHPEYSAGSPKKLTYSNSVGIEIDFDGRKNHVARVGTYGDAQNIFKRHRVLFIEDALGNTLSQLELTTERVMNEGSYDGYNLLADVPVAAGDFDGDGSDEVAVTYTTISAAGKYDKEVRVYKVSNNGKRLSLYKQIPQSDFAAYTYTGDSVTRLPQVHLAAGDLDDDNRDELIITSSLPHNNAGKTKEIVPTTTVWSHGKKESSLTKKAAFDHSWNYTEYNSDDNSGKTQFGAYGSAAVGDIDGDEKNELVMACNDVKSDKIGDSSRELNTSSALISAAKYSSGKYEKYMGAVGHSVKIHSSIQSAIWSNNTQQPMPLACFNPTGTGGKDLIFVDGVVYELCVDSAEAQYDGNIAVSSGHEAARFGFKKVLESDDIWPRDEKCYFGNKNDKSANIWIGTIAVGNFDNDENGGEQLIFDHGRKRNGKNEYRHDVVFLHKSQSGELISDNVCIDNNREASYSRNLDFAAIDNDNDGMKMKFKSKSAYFSSPNVVAVLQAAPYFADLEYMEPDYVEDGETVFGQTTGTGSSDTNGFSVTASAISGFKQETSFLGIARLGGGEWEVEAHASMGGEWENSTDISYTTEYSSDSRDDRVVLSMTPYIRYVYEMTIPAYKIPTYDEYTKQCGKLRGDNLEKYKKEVQLAKDKGFDWGATVPETKTDYVVCMPKTPRMSMIEVGEYDRIAEENGFEKIKGNVLNEIIGSPATYKNSESGLNEFNGGKDVIGTETGIDSGNFIWVSKGGGSVTQSIEKSTSKSSSITWGAGISTTIKSDIGGVIIGGSVGADYEGSHTWSNYSGTSCSGSVAGIPRDAIGLGYDFKWRFGQWKEKINGQECIVLGYLVKDVSAPPNAPKNLTVKDTTETTATLNWTHPTSVGGSYELYLVTSNPASPYYKLASFPSTQTEYVVEGLTPNTSYTFVMRSVNSTQASAYTVPVTALTRYSTGSNVPTTETLPDIHAVAGSNPSLETKATPAKGGSALTYQWQKLIQDGSVSSWQNIDGETSSSLTLYNVDKALNGTQYRCTVAQFVDGDVAYVYTNAASLYVGAGSTQTNLTISNPHGTAAGEYKIPYAKQTDVQKSVYAELNSKEYQLYLDADDGYMISDEGDEGDKGKYILNESGKAKAENAADTSFPLDASDAVKLTEVYEFADENGSFTGISEDAPFVSETGTITFNGESLTYTQKYTDGTKTVYVVENDVNGTPEPEYYYTASASEEPIAVTAQLYGYNDGTQIYRFKNASAVLKTVTEQQTEYSTKTVAGTELSLNAEVESLSRGVVVTPKGYVEFVITNADNGTQFKKRVALSDKASGNTNSVSYKWTAEVAGTYNITARYIESVELMTSVSGEKTYIAYAISSNAGRSTEKSIVFGCESDSVIIGSSLDMIPILREVEITDDGNKVTAVVPADTRLTSDNVTYTVTGKYGAKADGKYSFDGNIFNPTEAGTFVITAEYSYTEGSGEDEISRTLSVSKTINVKNPDSKVQSQIYFVYSSLIKNSTEKNIQNPLVNDNASDSVIFTSSDEAVASVDENGTVTPNGAGTAIIKAVSKLSGADDVSASYILTIRKTPVTITAPSITVTYGADKTEVIEKAAEAGVTVSDGVELSDITSDSLTYTTDYAYGKNIGNYTLSVADITSPKYEVNCESGKVTVEQKELSVSNGDFIVKALDKSYDGTKDVTLTVSIAPSSLITGDNVTADISGEFEDENAGDKQVNFEIHSLGGTNGSNYKLGTDLTGTTEAVISPMVISFISGVSVFQYDGEEKSVEPSAFDSFGRVFEDFTVHYYDSDMQELNASPINAGEYTVKFVPNDSVNYTAKNGEIKMSVKQASQERIEIIGLKGTVEYSDVFTLEAIGGSGNGKVEWTSDNENVTVTADASETEKATVEIKGAVGESVTITAVKTDDGNYSKSETKIMFVPVGKTLGFVISDLIKSYDGSQKEPTITTIPENGEYTVKYNGQNEIPTNAGTYTVLVSGSGNYRGTGNATMIIEKGTLDDKNLSVTLNDWEYKAENVPEPDYTAAPSGTTAEITYSTIDGNKPVNAGTYTVYATYSGENYEPYTVRNEFKIKKRTLTVTANDAERAYGEANPKFTVSYSGFADGEDESVLDVLPQAETTASISSPVTENGYPINVTGGRGANYELQKVSGILRILPASGGSFYIDGANNTATAGDIFTLRAHYDNFIPVVLWESENQEIASVDTNGKVTAISEGNVIIKATLNDSNYAPQTAEFNLSVTKKAVTLTPEKLVLTYNGSVQKINFISNTASFVPVTEGENKNVDVTYTLNTDSSVTEPKKVGTYTVVYRILGNSYTGGGTAQLTINKCKSEIKANDCEKTYGEENPSYTLLALIGEDAQNAEYIEKLNNMLNVSSDADSYGTKAAAGEYPITVSLKDGMSLDDENYDFSISQTLGKLTVKKKDLEIKVTGAQRPYGDTDFQTEYTYSGFVNDETEESLTAKPSFTVSDSITEATPVGKYDGVVTADGAESNNYSISYVYENGSAAPLTITQKDIKLTSASIKNGTLTVTFDKKAPNLTENNFEVSLNGTAMTLANITALNDGNSYQISSNFTFGNTYNISALLDNNYALTGSPVAVTYKRTSTGGGNSGGGGGGSTVSTPSKYTVTFESNGGSNTEAQKVTEKTCAKEPAVPEKEGYIFDGWYADKELTNKFDFASKITKNITLYAKWTENKDDEKTTEPSEIENPFKDVKDDDWFKDAVIYGVGKGIFKGKTSDTFGPNDVITRGMMATVLYRIEGEPEVNEKSTFTDVEAGSYCENAVAWAQKNNIVKGYSDTSYMPDKDISREEMAAIMHRYSIFKELENEYDGDIESFTDKSEVADWAKADVIWAVGSGLISGKSDKLLDPKGIATRAETAQIIKRFLELNK